jgi:Cap4-like dsDNA endonuclease family protein
MSESEKLTSTPDSVPPDEDVGADTQRRFRHQACYTAMLSLGLLDDDGPLEELYCEHHDDVILRLRSGSFKAVQLKTRMVGRTPFKAGDKEVIAALRKFTALEAKFPGNFEAYVLASNVGFWREQKNGNNLEHVLSEVRAGVVRGRKPLAVKIAEIEPAISRSLVLVALVKVQLETTPGLDDIESRLVGSLAQTSQCKGRRYDEMKAVSEGLRDRILAASSLAEVSALPEYVAICSSSPQAVRSQNVIQTKSISKDVVIEVLNHELPSEMLLRTYQHVPIDDLPTGMKKMELKLAAGGLTVSTIEHLKDLKFSTEGLLISWLYKYGRERAQQYYEHMRIVVHGECLAAQHSSHQVDRLYANKMLLDLRQKLAYRASARGDEIPEHRQEHLLGMAAILTEDCTVWWTAEFELPEGNQ